MLLDDALGNRKPYTRTRLGASVFSPVEAVKNPGQIAWGNANASIDHGDSYSLLVQGSNHFHPAIPSGVFEGVVQQDQQELSQVVRVAPDECPFQRLQPPALQTGFTVGWVPLAADLNHDISQ